MSEHTNLVVKTWSQNTFVFYTAQDFRGCDQNPPSLFLFDFVSDQCPNVLPQPAAAQLISAYSCRLAANSRALIYSLQELL